MKILIASVIFYGTLFWLVVDFLFFAGLKINYLDLYEIPVYYNLLFVDNQPWLLWPAGIAALGALFMVPLAVRYKMLAVGTVLVCALVTWVPASGTAIGRLLFAKEHQLYRFSPRLTTNVTLLYSGRAEDYVLLPGKEKAVPYPKDKRVVNP